MRTKMKLIIWIAAGSFIAYIVLQWGMDIMGRKHTSPIDKGFIAEVNGDPISRSEYRMEIDNLSQIQAQRLGATQLTSEITEEIYETAFQTLVARKLLQQEVRRRGIVVTDDEILNVIRYSPPQEFIQAEEFQTDGEFDYEKYSQFIRDPQSFSFLKDYERRIKEYLPIQKIQLLVFSSAKIADSEVRDEYLRQNEKVKVQYISLLPDSAQPVEVNEEDISRYYADHSEDYVEPEKAIISYIFFEEKPNQEDERLTEERIGEVYDEALSGADFEELAMYYSEDPASVSKGGDLGWFTKGTMLPEFEDVVFSLKSGEISEPFRTSYGWHIAKVESHKTNKVKARHILLKIVPSAETMENLRSKIREFGQDARTIGFEQAAQKHGMETHETKEFSLDTQYVPGIGFSREIHSIITENRVGAISYPIMKEDKYYVFEIKRKKGRTLADLEQATSEIERRIRFDERKMHARQRASDIYEEISNGASLATVAKSNDLHIEKPPSFTRMSNVPGVLPQSPFFGAAFNLAEGEVSAPVETERAYYIIEAMKRLPIDEENFQEVKRSLRLELLQKEQHQLYVAWIETLRARAKIKDYRRKLI